MPRGRSRSRSSTNGTYRGSIRRRSASGSSGAGVNPDAVRRSARLLDRLTGGSHVENSASSANTTFGHAGAANATLNETGGAPDPGDAVPSALPFERAADLARQTEDASAAELHNSENSTFSAPDQYQMELVVQPPSHIRPGDQLHPPVIVRLDAHTASAAQQAHRGERLFAVLSVTNENGTATLSPPRSDLVRGNVAGSLQMLENEGGSRGGGESSASGGSGRGGRQEIGFLSFPNVAIRESGRYRLRVSLLAFSAQGPASGSRGPVQEVLSDLVEVDERAGSPHPGKSSVSAGVVATQRMMS